MLFPRKLENMFNQYCGVVFIARCVCNTLYIVLHYYKIAIAYMI